MRAQGLDEIRWYVAKTQPRFGAERRAIDALTSAGHQTYRPLYSRTRVLRGRRTERVLPLFPTYLFVAAVAHWCRVLDDARGHLLNLVMSGESPAIMHAAEVARLRATENHRGLVQLEERPRFLRDQRVRVTEGVFAGYRGLFQDATADERCSVLLSMLGRHVRVTLGAEALEAA